LSSPGLLEGWGAPFVEVWGYNDGAPSFSVLGNNPFDPFAELYTLRYSATTVIPVRPAPLATSFSPTVNTSNLTFILTNTADWIGAKFGQDVAVFYIGDLAAGTEVTLSLDGTDWLLQGHELSGYTLFNEDETTVPDGGATAMLLGACGAPRSIPPEKRTAMQNRSQPECRSVSSEAACRL
jgi:hypothetical protein